VTPDSIHLRREGNAAWITLNRPPLNVIDIPMMQAFSAALEQAADAEFVILRGDGRCFSAGVEVADHAPDRVRGMLESFHRIFRQLAASEAITISAVHGHCLGGGCELATFCDFVIAEEGACLGQPEIKLGCFPPIAMLTLPWLAGPRVALDLILTGRSIDAREAQRLGLVTRVVAEGDLLPAVSKLLAELRAMSRPVLQLTRRTLRRAFGLEFEKALEEVEMLYLDKLMLMEDPAEGIRAFVEKRPPVWRGR
jgi:cyclohexa-1,5-dienecarbonyl-CoA hydratase